MACDTFRLGIVTIANDSLWLRNGTFFNSPSMWGQLALALGSDSIFSDGIAFQLGELSGLTDALAQYPELADQLVRDLTGTLATNAVLTAVLCNPATQSLVISMISYSVYPAEKLNNPCGTDGENRFRILRNHISNIY